MTAAVRVFSGVERESAVYRAAITRLQRDEDGEDFSMLPEDYDNAFVGVAVQNGSLMAVHDRAKLASILELEFCADSDDPEFDAEEWISQNIEGSYGPGAIATLRPVY